jgi:phosphoglucomutase
MPAEPAMLANIPRLMTAYYTTRPDPSRREQRVAFGTSGHRGSALVGSFNEAHILAITQAICEYRRRQDIDGLLFLELKRCVVDESWQNPWKLAAVAMALVVVTVVATGLVVANWGDTKVVEVSSMASTRIRSTTRATAMPTQPARTRALHGDKGWQPQQAGFVRLLTPSEALG